MLRIAQAELQYSVGSVLAWLGVLLVAAGWPLLESPGLSGVPSALAMMTLALPLITPISTFLQINVERNERRGRYWSTLPVSPATVAVARLLRAATLPAMAAAIGVLAVLLATIFSGGQVLERLSGGWVLGVLLLASVGTGILVTLLYDVGGMAFAQVVSAALIAVGFMLNSFMPQFERFAREVTSVAQTPVGLLLAAGACGLLAALSLLVFVRRSS